MTTDRIRTRRVRPTVEALEGRELLTIGALDPTFSGDGKQTYDVELNANDVARQAVLLPDGGVLIAGNSTGTAGGQNGFAVARFDRDGNPAGRSVIEFNSASWLYGIALQAGENPTEPRILLTGRVLTPGGDWGFGIARLLANGTLDSSFGAAVTPGRIVFDLTTGDDIPVGIAVRRDGKIIVGGTVRASATTTGTFGAILLSPNGGLDTSFGTNGMAGLSGSVAAALSGQEADATDLKLDANDNVLICGSTYVDMGVSGPSYRDIVLARFRMDGLGLDTAFNPGGPQPGVITADFNGNVADYAGRMTVQSDGRIVVSAASAGELCLARVTPAGLLDPSFDVDGKVQLQPPSGSISNLLGGTSVDARGLGSAVPLRIVATAQHQVNLGQDFFVARLLGNGSLDEAFSGDGNLSMGLSTNSADSPADVLFQNDGKVIVVGLTRAAGATSSDFFATRFENDQLAFSLSRYDVAETDGFGTLTVTRMYGKTGTLTVQVTNTRGTATPGIDYTAVAQTLTFGPDVTTRTFRVFVHPDGVAEGDEGVVLTLSNVQGGADLVPGFDEATLVIRNVAAAVNTPPVVAQPRARGIVAVLRKLKQKGKTRTTIRVSWADTGELKEEMPCPFQGPQYRGVTVGTLDTDGDGVGDTARVVGKRGKKLLERRYRLG